MHWNIFNIKIYGWWLDNVKKTMDETKIRKIVKEENKESNKPIVKKLDDLSKAVIGNGNTKDCLISRVAQGEERDDAIRQSIIQLWTFIVLIVGSLIGFAIWVLQR